MEDQGCSESISGVFSGPLPDSHLEILSRAEANVRSGPCKPNQRKVSSWTFHSGIPEQKFNSWIALVFLRKKTHQNSQKWAKFMNLSAWPFLSRFGLPGRLLIMSRLYEKCFFDDSNSNSSSGSQEQGHYPRKIPWTPAEPRRAPQNPRRDAHRGL